MRLADLNLIPLSQHSATVQTFRYTTASNSNSASMPCDDPSSPTYQHAGKKKEAKSQAPASEEHRTEKAVSTNGSGTTSLYPTQYWHQANMFDRSD